MDLASGNVEFGPKDATLSPFAEKGASGFGSGQGGLGTPSMGSITPRYPSLRTQPRSNW